MNEPLLSLVVNYFIDIWLDKYCLTHYLGWQYIEPIPSSIFNCIYRKKSSFVLVCIVEGINIFKFLRLIPDSRPLSNTFYE